MLSKMALATFVVPFVAFPVVAAHAQSKPCPPRVAQSFDRGTNPAAEGKAPGGPQTAQSFDRGTNPAAEGKAPAGPQTAQSFDRGTNPAAAGKPPGGLQTAQSFDRGTNPAAAGKPPAGLQTAQSFGNVDIRALEPPVDVTPEQLRAQELHHGAQTAQSFDRGTNPAAAGKPPGGVQTASAETKGVAGADATDCH